MAKRKGTRKGADAVVGKFEMMRVDAIIPDPDNPRDHPEGQIRRVADSITRFGFNAPILIDGSGVIVAGHARLQAAKRLKLSEVPVVRLDHLSPGERRAYQIADNRLTEIGAWNDEMLADRLREIVEQDRDLVDLVGFTRQQVSDLLDLVRDPSDGGGDDEGATKEGPGDLDLERRAALGDIWVLGGHRLMCGSSTSEGDVRKLMGDARAALVVTDPPYGVDFRNLTRPTWSKKRQRVADTSIGSHYIEVSREEYEGFTRQWLSLAIAVRGEGAPMYVWHGHTDTPTIFGVARDLGMLVHQPVIWVKPSTLSTYSVLAWQHEQAVILWPKGSKPVPKVTVPGFESTVWNVDWEGKARAPTGDGLRHPAQKPLALFSVPMQMHTLPGDVCYEPFSGSGAQILAGEQVDRRVYAMELSPRYVDLALHRWEQMTGRKARLINGRRKGRKVSGK